MRSLDSQLTPGPGTDDYRKRPRMFVPMKDCNNPPIGAQPIPEEPIVEPIVEIVAFGHNRGEQLASFVHNLHEYLDRNLPLVWELSIADNGSTDGSWALASSLAGELPFTKAVRLEERLGRKELRFQWKESQALVAAFLEIGPDQDFERKLTPLIPDAGRRTESDDQANSSTANSLMSDGLTRRRALVALGTIGLSAFLAACARAAGDGTTIGTTIGTTGAVATTGSTATTDGPGSTPGSTTATTAGAIQALDCVLLPEMTEGPYYLDLDLVRSNIAEDRVGAPLALTIVVADADSCTPIQDAAVDLWHCDAEGIYSGFVAASTGQGTGTDDTVFLRGTQITDNNGAVTFQTLYPGWYEGRTVHMHMKVHVGGSTIHTTQLFFDDAFTDEVYAANEPYASRNNRGTLNSNDNIYSGGGEATTLNVSESTGGYAATLVVGVQS